MNIEIETIVVSLERVIQALLFVPITLMIVIPFFHVGKTLIDDARVLIKRFRQRFR
jgi:hypothetical protein